MRKIFIDKIELPDKQSHYTQRKLYSVFLGNETKRYFSSIKDARAFLANTNRFLNDRVHELNYFYGVVFSEYRGIWFFLNTGVLTEKKINYCFEAVNTAFKLACGRSQSANGNYFTFKHIFAIIDGLCNACKLILECLEEKKYYSDVKRVRGFYRQIQFIRNDLNNYGKENWNEISG